MGASWRSAVGVGRTWIIWAVLAILPAIGGSSCVEYEQIVNGSGHRLRTCPLDNPPSYVYCCVDTCCEEPHLAILLTSVIGGVVITVIGVGLIVLCAIDMHRVTCQENHDLESPLISDEEDDFLDDPKLPPSGKWCTKHKVMGAPPGEKGLHRSRDPSPEDPSVTLESAMTCDTEVTSLSATPMENGDLTEDEDDLRV